MDEEHAVTPTHLTAHQLTLWAWVVALVCTGIAIPWIKWIQQRPLIPLLIGATPLRDALVGAVTGLVGTYVVWHLFMRVPSLRRVVYQLRDILTPDALRPGNIPLIALSAGVGEELLFRGVLQYHLGLWWTALLFGLAHPLSLAYIVYATGAGLVLGGLVQITGALLPAIVCHTIVDTILLYQLRTIDGDP